MDTDHPTPEANDGAVPAAPTDMRVERTAGSGDPVRTVEATEDDWIWPVEDKGADDHLGSAFHYDAEVGRYPGPIFSEDHYIVEYAGEYDNTYILRIREGVSLPDRIDPSRYGNVAITDAALFTLDNFLYSYPYAAPQSDERDDWDTIVISADQDACVVFTRNSKSLGRKNDRLTLPIFRKWMLNLKEFDANRKSYEAKYGRDVVFD